LKSSNPIENFCNSISHNNLMIGIRLNPLSIIQCFYISFTWLKDQPFK
jgi:hypothetical protein